MDYFIYKMFYVSLMVTTKQKLRVDSQKIKEGETENTTTENHQFKKVDRNRGIKKQWNYKIARKQLKRWL